VQNRERVAPDEGVGDRRGARDGARRGVEFRILFPEPLSILPQAVESLHAVTLVALLLGADEASAYTNYGAPDALSGVACEAGDDFIAPFSATDFIRVPCYAALTFAFQDRLC
jgi:hypothetical protein